MIGTPATRQGSRRLARRRPSPPGERRPLGRARRLAARRARGAGGCRASSPWRAGRRWRPIGGGNDLTRKVSLTDARWPATDTRPRRGGAGLPRASPTFYPTWRCPMSKQHAGGPGSEEPRGSDTSRENLSMGFARARRPAVPWSGALLPSIPVEREESVSSPYRNGQDRRSWFSRTLLGHSLTSAGGLHPFVCMHLVKNLFRVCLCNCERNGSQPKL